jgi:hypothetical protein
MSFPFTPQQGLVIVNAEVTGIFQNGQITLV